jgi:hypothetical protein
MHATAQLPQGKDLELVALKPPLARPPALLTELAGCLMFGTACTNLWLEINTLIRASIYVIAVVLAFLGGGLKLRLTARSSFLFLSGGLFILTALLYPPVPILVRDDIRNIIVGWAFLSTLGLSDLTAEAWDRFQLRVHRTVMTVSTVGAVLGLAKLLYFIQGGIILALMDPERGYPLGTSLCMDYNFYSLPLLLGLLSAFWLMKRDQSSFWRTTALVCLPALAGAVLLSGSRRGLITVLCAVLILSAWLIFSSRRSHPGKRGAGISWKAVLAGLCLLAVLCVLKLDPLIKGVDDLTSARSFSDVMGRWRTFEEGTYSDSRMHYWTVALQRLSRFEPLDYAIGDGFGYVTDFGADPTSVEDYPHNFLLSSMFYGGLLQTLCLIAMVSVVLLRLSGRVPGAGMFAGWFVLVIFFLSTSCNSFFSSEIAVFLTVLGLGLKGSGQEQSGVSEIGEQPAQLRPGFA